MKVEEIVLTKKKEGILQGIIYLMTSQVIIKLLGMIYSLYLTNKKGFGDEGNAICMAGFQFYALILGLCAIGVPNTMSKMISERMEVGEIKICNQILKVALVTFATISFGFCLCLYQFSDFIAVHILSIAASSEILKILAPSIVFSTMESVYRGYFNGIKKVSISAKSTCLEQCLKTFLTIIFVEKIGEVTCFHTEMMAKGSMFAASIATIASFLYSYIKYKKVNNNLRTFDTTYIQKLRIRTILKEMFAMMLPISLTTALMILGNNIDSISIVRILKSKIGESQARKIYGIITSKVNLITNLPLALNGAVSISLIPEISRNVMKRNSKKLKKNIQFSVLITLMIAIPSTLVLLLFSKQVMHILYPNASKGAELLKLSSISIIFLCLTQNISGILQGVGDSKSHLIAATTGMVIKFILNFCLISNENFLEKGAIISSIASNFVIFFIMFEKCKKTLITLKNQEDVKIT